MNNELISVIIPVFNVQDYLNECIESVIGQTYKNLEIVMINDESTDHSGQICDQYADKDKRIKVIHQKKGGVSAARNTGIAHAHGEYVCWVDSDDYINSELIAELYSMIQNLNVKISVCDYIQGSERNHDFHSDQAAAVRLTAEQLFQYLYVDSHSTFIVNASWGKLIHKDLYQDIQYPEGKIFEDIYTTYKLIGKCDSVAYKNSPLYYYFKHDKSIMHSPFNKQKQDYLEALEERIEYFINMNMKDLSEKARINYLHSLMWEFSRSKDILKDKKGTNYIVQKYREYYHKGDCNPQYQHETEKYMSEFYKNPYLLDFKQKVNSKLRK